MLLVLLHDFPEFLCDYHYGFCDVIPPNCIQLRNLILSAFPRNMRLPDPFTPNLKVRFQTVRGKENYVLILIVLVLVNRCQANHLLGGPTAQNCKTNDSFSCPISQVFCLDCWCKGEKDHVKAHHCGVGPVIFMYFLPSVHINVFKSSKYDVYSSGCLLKD